MLSKQIGFYVILVMMVLTFIVGRAGYLKIQSMPPKPETPQIEPTQVREQPKPVEPKKVDAAPVVQEKPKAKKYTDEQIRDAREYVGNYRVMTREINKMTLRCIMIVGDESESTEEKQVRCEKAARKAFGMKTDDESVKRLEAKYQEQVKIARS